MIWLISNISNYLVLYHFHKTTTCPMDIVHGQCSFTALTIYLVACYQGALVCFYQINMTSLSPCSRPPARPHSSPSRCQSLRSCRHLMDANFQFWCHPLHCHWRKSWFSLLQTSLSFPNSNEIFKILLYICLKSLDLTRSLGLDSAPSQWIFQHQYFRSFPKDF